MISTKLKLAVAALAAAAIVTMLILQNQSLKRLRLESNQLREQISLAAQSPAASVIEADTNEIVRLRAEHDELLRLRGELAPLRRERDDLLRRAASTNASNRTFAADNKAADTAWVKQILNGPPAQQGAAAGALRGKLLGYDTNNVTASEFALRDALLERQLNSLERSPAEFAEFQSAFIQSTLGISDAAKVEQVRQLIRQTYEQAVSQGLDIPSKPATDTESWVQRRHQLDRLATATMKQLLTPEEQQMFDRAFLGVMGVDLGGVGVDKSNYPPGFLR